MSAGAQNHGMRTTIQGGDLPANGFDDPFGMLEACHHRLHRMLDLLTRLRAHLETHGPDEQARQAAKDVARYFDQAAPQHHRDEELHVFPALRAMREPALTALVDRLAADHAAMELGWVNAGRVLRAIAAGELQTLDVEDAAALDGFGQLYKEHVEAEERVAYPRARRVIDAPGLASMGAEMQARRGGPK